MEQDNKPKLCNLALNKHDTVDQSSFFLISAKPQIIEFQNIFSN